MRIGALVRNADLAHDRGLRPALSGGGRGAAVRRLGAAAQRRDRRRQSAAAHALRLFLRRRERLQQTRARRRLRRAAAARTGCTPCSAGASTASPPTRRISACRWSRSTPWSRSRAKAGRREVPLEDFHRLPGDTPERETRARAGRADRRRAPAGARRPRFAAHARYLKVRERTSYAFAVVSAAAALRLDGGAIVEARIALGGVAPKPWRARAAEAALAGARAGRGGLPPGGRGGARRCAGPPATTPSRSNSRAASSCARSRSPRPARPSACPRFRPRPSPPPGVLHHA